ncbi:putative S-adenosylmethionine-dependent methyltransferase [bacterium HR15]|nr:putative S-adenosylmethionine-dependent methyltransferase [bacterium HR15]
MQAEEYARMFQFETDYWWFVGRRRLVMRLLQPYLSGCEGWILDAGCGTGAMLCELQGFGQVVGLDLEPLALRYARQRGEFALVQARLESLPFRAETFCAITALDVLEHLPDDRPAFQELWRVLQPRGVLVVTVPAYRFLWSKHDIALRHYRRYTARELGQRLCEAGFEVQKLSYAVSVLFVPIMLFRWWDRWRRTPPAATLVPVNPAINRWLIRLQEWEARLIQRVNLPFGVSLVAVARKGGK